MQQATETTNTTSVAAGPLKSLLARIEQLEEDKAETVSAIKEVYAEAKAQGFDPGTMRRIVRLRKMSEGERSEQEAMLDLYLSALGMLASTPLGRHAAVKAAIKGLGTPADPTKEEAAAGVIAAFVKDGTRMTITPGGVPKAA
jgi:uncharacterized protein (UPF0335 family)